jgi:hypothetical protein
MQFLLGSGTVDRAAAGASRHGNEFNNHNVFSARGD